MNLFKTLAMVGFFGVCSASGEDICHFNHVDIPTSEARLLELARTIEFRSNYILPKLNGTSRFIAERYQDGKCVSIQCFSLGIYGEPSEGYFKGIISFGWQMDDQKLVGVNDTGYFREPGYALFPGFHSSRPIVWTFFKDSRAEPRIARDGYKFDLYPVIGIRGSKEQTISGMTISGKTGDISSVSQEKLISYFRNQPDGIIVYLYFGSGIPNLDYSK